MKYLVTGGAGFIGSNIVKVLLEQGHEVTVLDNFSTGNRENIAQYKGDIHLEEGDIRSYHIVQKVVNNIDYILHQAALPSVPRSIADPVTTNDVNVNGTLNILHAAVDADVKRVVFASSSSVYGNSPRLPKKEDMTPQPLSPYAVSKLTGENYCKVFANIYGLHTLVLRYFNVFGPNQNPDSQYSAVIPKFIKMVLNNESPTIYGDGEQSRDFTFVANVVQANLAACEVDCPPGLVMNCAAHQRITVNQMLDVINGTLGKDVRAYYADPRPGDVKHSFADIDTIKKILGYEPRVLFEEGMDQMIRWASEKYRLSGQIPSVAI